MYSNTKFEAESYVRASSLEWVVLRLGGVLSPNFSALPLTADGIFIESALPTDGRIHTVDVRDVGVTFAAATTADGRSAYRNAPGTYADLWVVIAARLGDPCLHTQRPTS